MSIPSPFRLHQGTLIALLVVVAWTAGESRLWAQSNLNQKAVGGIAIDTDGVLTNIDVSAREPLRQLRRRVLEQAPGDLAQPAAMRKVSLRGLNDALRGQIENAKPLTDAMKYLAGLQQIQYVFVYPEQHDIVLVGPGEGWKVDGYGDLVGATTGKPLMLLDDLIVALRAAKDASRSEITCSIDPTQEGVARLREFAAKLRGIVEPLATRTAIEKTLGPQNITVTGVPPTSHFAQVLVAADYRMKRLAMNFDPAPIRGLPSYLDMLRLGPQGMANMTPRWWLVPAFEPVVRDPDGVAWQLRINSVKAMTEETFFAADGSSHQTGQTSAIAQKWADNMTAKYAELSVADPIFGRLRNCMELAVVAALIVKEDLSGKADCRLATLMDTAGVAPEQFPAPRKVDAQASLVKKGKGWIISASGGVRINSWDALEKPVTDASPAAIRTQSAPATSANWWWN
jgi:hypothetical protein